MLPRLQDVSRRFIGFTRALQTRKSSFGRSDPAEFRQRANMFVSVDLYVGCTSYFAPAYFSEKAAARASRSAAAETCFNFRRRGTGASEQCATASTRRGNVNNRLSATSRRNKSATNDTQRLPSQFPPLPFLRNNINRHFSQRQSGKCTIKFTFLKGDSVSRVKCCSYFCSGN